MLRGKGFYRSDKYMVGAERQCSPRASALAGPGKHTPARRRKAPATAFEANTSQVLAVASRLASMADGEVRQRYHDLVDKSLGGELTALERFELERIEVRLDAEDKDSEIEGMDRKWELERTELLDSIEGLLGRLRR